MSTTQRKYVVSQKLEHVDGTKVKKSNVLMLLLEEGTLIVCNLTEYFRIYIRYTPSPE
jgi:hypothetical protein